MSSIVQAKSAPLGGDPWPGDSLMTAPLRRALWVSIGAATSFYVLLSVVPLYTTTLVTGDGLAGAATASLMWSSVAGELVAALLISRFGQRFVLGGGLLLLGTPALVLGLLSDPAAVVILCGLRGLGFGMCVVVAAVLVAEAVPPGRRGEGFGVFGAISTAPSVLALPLGVWLVPLLGYPAVFAIGAIAPLLALVAVRGADTDPRAQTAPSPALDGAHWGSLVRPALIFSSTTLAAGIVLTFVPVVSEPAGPDAVAWGLLAHSLAATVSRLLAGRYGDRHGAASLVLPGLLASSAGLFALAVVGNAGLLMVGMTLFGIGFGLIQNATLTLMFERVPPAAYSLASAVWNGVYDAGMGLGALAFAGLAGHTGYPIALTLSATLMLPVIAAAWPSWSVDRARIPG